MKKQIIVSREYPESVREFYVGGFPLDQLNKQINGASCICFHEQKVLLITHRKRGLEYVSGGRDAGESITETILRELKEEAGVQKIDGLKPFGYIQIQSIRKELPKEYILIFMGEVHPDNITGPMDDEDKIIGYNFFDTSTLEQTTLSKESRIIIETAHSLR